jgi:tripartite-type tricarboxylate transporter receptor subunit TctC
MEIGFQRKEMAMKKMGQRKEQTMKSMKSLPFKTLGILLALCMVLALATAAAAAEAYPTKPIRLIVPFPPGGSNDIIGRLIAAQLTERLGKQVYVENHAGAGGVLGTEIVAKSKPDGYTLLIISAAHAFNASLYKLPYDHEKAFIPIAKLATGPNALVVYPGLPANSVKDIVALAKEKPGNLKFAAAGIGSFQHLGTELFRMQAGIDIMIVQFKGGGPSVIDVMGGHTDAALASLIMVMSHIQSGKLKALGTGGAKRSVALPDVPTIAEAGVPGYEANNWWGILAPAGTPQVITDRLNKELSAILSSAETRKQFLTQGAEVDQMGQIEFGKFITAETKKWARVVKEANIKVE